jgi:hypothetical protein
VPIWPRRFSPLGCWGKVPAAEVAARLRPVFTVWGLPQRIRVDNGTPWAKRGDLPQELALWWMGLGAEVIWNRPRRPQQNGRVERSQGVSRRWAEPHQCASAAALQQRLARVNGIQREQYPAIRRQSRLQAYPGLAAGGRPYDPTQEEARWALEAVCRYLAQGVRRRRVDAAGKISLYNAGYQVSQRRAGEWVSVRFDATAREWVILEDGGQELKRYPAEQITRERILGFEVGHRKHQANVQAREKAQPSAGDGEGQPCVA